MVRDKGGGVARIVEQADATRDELAIGEVNTSIYVFRRSVLAPALRRLSPVNSQGEYYLTDTIAVLHDAGYSVEAVVVDDPMEAAGVNDRQQLAVAEAELRDRINERWMRRGVTMVDPEHTYIDTTVDQPRCGPLPRHPPAGPDCGRRRRRAGASTQLSDCTVGPRAVVTATIGRNATVGSDAHVGPWGYLPPGAKVPAGFVTGACFTGGVDDVDVP